MARTMAEGAAAAAVAQSTNQLPQHNQQRVTTQQRQTQRRLAATTLATTATATANDYAPATSTTRIIRATATNSSRRLVARRQHTLCGVDADAVWRHCQQQQLQQQQQQQQQQSQRLRSRSWRQRVARTSKRRSNVAVTTTAASSTFLSSSTLLTPSTSLSLSPSASSSLSLASLNYRAATLPTSLSSSSSWLSFRRLGVNYNLRKDSIFMMITMFAVVMAIVIAENAVFAAQRDSFKQKNPNNLSNNANAIQIGGNGSTGGTGTGNGNGSGSGAGNTATGINANTNTNNNNNNSRHSNDNISNGNPNGSDASSTITTTATVAAISTVTTATVAAPVTTSSSSSSGSAQRSVGGGSAYGSGASASAAAAANRNAIDVTDDSRNGPYFDKAASKNVTALLGKTAYLNCRVKNLGNKTMLLQVSWVRHRDIHLLTVGRYTYTSDQRFRAIHQPQTEDWILQIKYPQHRDSGIYECQVSTTPHMSHYIHLNVVEPSTEIIGAPDLYIESGSTINLTCVILNSPEPPAYIFWNHNNAIINYDSPRGGVSVVTNKGDTTTSFLLIKSARPSDSGHYQCNPSNAKPKSVTVHVLNGEFPAAMQRAGQALHRMSPSHYLLVYLSMYLCSLAYVTWYMRPSAASAAAAAAIGGRAKRSPTPQRTTAHAAM